VIATAEYVITISDPALRGFAETALDFIKSVYRDRVLGELAYVFVSSKSERDLDELKRAVGAKLPEDGDRLVQVASPPMVSGIYSHEAGAVLIKLGSGGVHDFWTVAHEFAHHAIYDGRPRLLGALINDVPELDAIVRALFPVIEETRVVRAVEGLGEASFTFAQELATEYATANYFVLLNASPAVSGRDIMWLRLLPGFATLDIPSRYLDRALDRLETALHGKGLPTGLVRRCLGLIKAVRGKVRDYKTELAEFRATLHSIMRGKVKRWPKEVYLSNPEKYEILFEGLDREWMREEGVPMMV